MNAAKEHAILFNKDQEVILNYVGMIENEIVYSHSVYFYDLESNEKSTLTLTINVSELTERDKRIAKLRETLSGAIIKHADGTEEPLAKPKSEQ